MTMPRQRRIQWAELRVGIMAIVALAILGYLIFLLSGSGGFFRGKSHIYTYVSNSVDLAKGAPVRLNGIDVGSVGAVRLSGSDDPRRVVQIQMDIDDDKLSAIPVDSTASNAQSTLLSPYYMNIQKGRSKQTVKPNAELASSQTAELDTLFQQGNNALSALQDTIKKADNILDTVQSGQGTIGKFLVDPELYDKAVGLVNQFQKLGTTLNSSQGTIGKLLNDDQLYTDVQGSIARFNTLMDGLQQGQGTAGKLLKDPALYDDSRATIADIRKTIDQANELLTNINAGKGTAGKLLKSDDLANQLHDNLAHLDSILQKVNSGQGTLGQLLVNPSLYESIDGATRELHGLLKDFRANPKKFLSIKLHIF